MHISLSALPCSAIEQIAPKVARKRKAAFEEKSSFLISKITYSLTCKQDRERKGATQQKISQEKSSRREIRRVPHAKMYPRNQNKKKALSIGL